MICKYCNKKLDLKRFIKENYEGEFVNERIIFVCNECKIIISPRFMVLSDCETEREKKVLRDLYFQETKEN